MGGTDFYEFTNPQAYWSTTNNSTTQASALGYTPETTWNNSCTNAIWETINGLSQNPETNCNNPELNDVVTDGGSGGASNCISPTGSTPASCTGGYPKPSWQSGSGVPTDSKRDLPDVSLFASNGFAGSFYVICQSDQSYGSCSSSFPDQNFLGFGGTSVSSPAFAGIMALVNQQTGSRQGYPVTKRLNIGRWTTLELVYDLPASHSSTMKLSQIASALNARLDNSSADTEITGLNGIEQAGPGELTFVANPKYAAAARLTKAAAVIVAENFPVIPAATLRVEDPYLSFAHALELFHLPLHYAPGVHPTAVVHPTAKIGRSVHLGPYVVVDEHVEIGDHAVLLAHVVIYRGVKIGDNFFAHAHAVVRENCRIGNNVLLQNGVVIGSDGFGFAKTHDGHWRKIPQPAPVVIEDDVEVQANSCIDRASVGETRIGRGVKIDNLVQVGHGSQVGEDALLCSQVGLAGSTEIGKRVILTGQVGVVGHCKIGEAAIVTPQSGVAHDIPAGALVSGAPAVDHKLWLKYSALLPKLPEMARALRARTKE